MAQVVVAGCGYVGNELARMLLAEGHEVFGLRRDSSKLAPGVRAIEGGVARPGSPGPAPQRVEHAVFAVGSAEGIKREPSSSSGAGYEQAGVCRLSCDWPCCT